MADRDRRRGRAFFAAALAATLLVHVLLAAGIRLSVEGAGRSYFGGRSPFLAHAGLLLAEVALLSGAWLLARVHFRRPESAFLVGVAAAGSALWVDHVWSNVFSIATLPLLLWLLHGVLEAGTGWKLFAALALAGAQGLANRPETALVTPVAAALYFPALAFVSGEPLRGRLRRLDLGRLARPAAAGLACGLGALAVALARGSPSGGFFERFLLATTLENPAKYLDLVIGLSPRTDFSLFAGSFTAAFAIAGLAGLSRGTILRLCAAAPAGLVLLGLIVALPPPVSSDPVAAGAAVARLGVVFLAGLGLDRLLAGGEVRPVRIAGGILTVSAVALGTLALAVEQLVPGADAFLRHLAAGAPQGLRAPAAHESPWIPEFLAASGVGAAWAGGTLLLRSGVPRAAPLALALLVVLHPLDVFGWKFRTTWVRSRPATEARTP